ncbi:hypothetical protein ACFXJ8_19100 [Nonomuraea sp. NPDC059194]|uniref:hypothetical protein n=1 Tax=Nonomuraea sp. NPDC059194 TaxID=3346764 RepID=UPI00368DDC97
MEQKQRMPRPVDIACLVVTIQAALAAVGAVFMGALMVAGPDIPWVAWVLMLLTLAAGVCGWMLADRMSSRRRRVLASVIALEAAVFAAGVASVVEDSDPGLLSLVNPHLIAPVVVTGLLLVPSSARAWFDR